MLIMLVCVGVVVGGLAYWKRGQIEGIQAFGPPPTAVTTVIVEPQTWQPTLKAVGTLKAVNGLVLSTDMAGIVSGIAFESGSAVKKGQVLLTLDPDQEQAALRMAEARLTLAQSNRKRTAELLGKKLVAQNESDAAESELRQAQANVEEARALVARKRIVAPFDGVLGIRMVNNGQYLNAGMAIVPLQSLDPIYVDFSLPQHQFQYAQPGTKVQVRASGAGDVTVEGTVTAVDSQIDETTRNFNVQGTLANTDHKLRPGMFAEVELLLPEQKSVLAIPVTAISYAPYGDSVYVVVPGKGPDGQDGLTVQQHFVKLGIMKGDLVEVTSGIKAGDQVVSSGTFKLMPGGTVMINNAVKPSASIKPQVEDR